MDTPLDIEYQKLIEWREARKSARRDYCERDCDQHNEQCPYYDAEQESWDCDLCFEERG